jgi:pilus assembly protein Flp/PilA
MQHCTHFWSGLSREAKARISAFWSDEEGQTLIEYALLISLIALVIIAAVTFFGRRIRDGLYGTANSGLPFSS